jgi:hypothetical protein
MGTKKEELNDDLASLVAGISTGSIGWSRITIPSSNGR